MFITSPCLPKEYVKGLRPPFGSHQSMLGISNTPHTISNALLQRHSTPFPALFLLFPHQNCFQPYTHYKTPVCPPRLLSLPNANALINSFVCATHLHPLFDLLLSFLKRIPSFVLITYSACVSLLLSSPLPSPLRPPVVSFLASPIPVRSVSTHLPSSNH